MASAFHPVGRVNVGLCWPCLDVVLRSAWMLSMLGVRSSILWPSHDVYKCVMGPHVLHLSVRTGPMAAWDGEKATMPVHLVKSNKSQQQRDPTPGEVARTGPVRCVCVCVFFCSLCSHTQLCVCVFAALCFYFAHVQTGTASATVTGEFEVTVAGKKVHSKLVRPGFMPASLYLCVCVSVCVRPGFMPASLSLPVCVCVQSALQAVEWCNPSTSCYV